MNDKYNQLRQQYPVFEYKGYDFEILDDRIEIRFDFAIGSFEFHPQMSLHPGHHIRVKPQADMVEPLVFQIGLIELISYWKCCCPPLVRVSRYKLGKEAQQWWKKLYFNGLGEFFYQNGINATEEDFLDFSFADDALPADRLRYPQVTNTERVLVPVGGGKDSVVTLEDLRSDYKIVPFIINPRGATLDCARIAGFPEEKDVVVLKRQIDPLLISLNSRGFLNGHTPFSAMLSFYSLLVSYVTDTRDVALSNESSANEPTIPGTKVNHQYSKSLEYEEDFRWYVKTFLNDANHYYSHLRPLTELQIAERFARHQQYFKVFKSCNAGSKQNIWCCNCSKCLFAYIILSPFIDNDTMVDIFGEDLLDKPSLLQYFDELTGMAPNKPFECVGTLDEVNEALRRILPSRKDKFLVKHYISQKGLSTL